MADHFSLDVRPAQVLAARRRVERVLEMLAERTPLVLSTPDEIDAEWTGRAARRVKREMRALGAQLDAADKPLKDASRSLRHLAEAYDDALAELPSLNRRWETALAAHASAVRAANDRHARRLDDIASSGPADTEATREADRRRNDAVGGSRGELASEQRRLEDEFEVLRADLEAETRAAARALRGAMLVTPTAVEEALARGGSDNQMRERYWTELARARLAEELPLAAGHHSAVATLESRLEDLRLFGMEVPEHVDSEHARGLVQALERELTALEGLDARTRSERINQWAGSLDPVGLSVLTLTAPELVGNLDGMPNRARYAANRANLATAIESERAQLERCWSPPPADDHPGWAEYQRLRGRIRTLEGLLEQPRGKDPHQVLAFTPPSYDGDRVVDDGRLAVVRGDLDTARYVGTVVPGITNRIDNFQATLDKAANLHDEVPDSATIAWLGYDTPEFADAASTHRSEVGGRALLDFTEGLVRAADSELTILAHSYGTVVTSQALQLGMVPDRVVLFGSPGLGEHITHRDDLGLPPDVPVYAMRAFGDPVSITAGHGMDPVDMPGIIRLDTDWSGPEDVTGHSDYTRAGSDSLRNLAGVLRGFAVRPPGVEGPGYLEPGGNALADDGFAGAYNENLRELVDLLQAEVPPEVLESFVSHLEPTAQNVLEGGATPGVADVRDVTAMVRRALDESGIGDHLTAQELRDALVEAGLPATTGDLAGDWVREQIDGWDGLDDLTIPLRGGIVVHVPAHANEVLGDLLGRVTEVTVEGATAWTAQQLPELETVLEGAETVSDIVLTGTHVTEVLRSLPEVLMTPRLLLPARIPVGLP